MSNIVPFSSHQNRRVRLNQPINLEAAKAVADCVSLRPGPSESPAQFVTRIVRAYKAAEQGAL